MLVNSHHILFSLKNHLLPEDLLLGAWFINSFSIQNWVFCNGIFFQFHWICYRNWKGIISLKGEKFRIYNRYKRWIMNICGKKITFHLLLPVRNPKNTNFSPCSIKRWDLFNSYKKSNENEKYFIKQLIYGLKMSWLIHILCWWLIKALQ